MEYAWGTHADGTAYTAALWPLALGVTGVLVSIVAGILLAGRPRGRERFGTGTLAICIFATLLGMVVAAGIPPLAAMEGMARAWQEEIFTRTSFWELFPHVVVGGSAGLLTVVITGISLAVHLSRPGPRAGTRAVPAHLLWMLGAILAALSWGEAVWLCHVGPMPGLDTGLASARIHAGRQATIVPRVVGTGAGSWTPRPLIVKAEDAGEMEITLEATRPLVKVARTVTVEVGQDTPDPLFPLAVGNWWSYRYSHSRTDRLLIFFESTHEYESEIHMARVTGEAVVQGLTTYTLEWTAAGGHVASFEAYDWNGVAHVHPGWPIVERIEPVLPAPGSDPPKTPTDAQAPPLGPPEPAATPCTFMMFEGQTCSCLLEPAGNAKLPGPMRCVEQRGTMDDLLTIGSLMVGIMTAGILVPGLESGGVWEMVGSGTSRSSKTGR